LKTVRRKGRERERGKREENGSRRKVKRERGKYY